ncbi:M20/M25/M40 family metallo-hydrolase [Nocardia blacklockiae]|uniref:M20/M25/M40 family metallo-hydrolase n=1 Tax=Nocardia blacklockiae TaxID=480036 RepID=UPI0018944923|nr:M20/M25/M40 family metallo-hydrolase [Nocardia blacklockiae]MBF6175557.1 M20/M25/M40 family metallo-hydrolase [Nocardia blacklockiae]
MTSSTRAATGVDDRTAERLAAALRCATVSSDSGAATPAVDAEFDKLGKHLERSFPLVHDRLEMTGFGHSRLYRWAGTEPGTAAILLAHLDVVPVDDEQGWTHPPFAGVVDDEFVWGRGAIDDKSRVLAILEAVETALAAGRRPEQTIFLAFGHDEEAMGCGGAARMAAHLHSLEVRAELLLDEGGVVTEGVAPGARRPTAFLMLGEKGWATVRLAVTDPGGHSSMPGRQTAVGRIARAVARLQDHPMPLRMTPVTADMLTRIRPAMSALPRAALGLLPVARGAVARLMATRPQTEALVRTTTAPTVIRGGVKANVLPQSAEALVNFRILPGDSVTEVLEHCRRVVRDDGIDLELVGMSSEPSAITGPGPAFDVVAGIARAVVPDAVITTGMVPGATDSRYYDGLATTRCNFAPVVLDPADLKRIHGTDERLSRPNYARLIDFNRRLIDHYTREA